jgi:L-seryl-tRNA(Ser) seleniumtransferase
MGELHRAAGRYLAGLIGVEAAHICSCATAGISLMAAACMTGSDRDHIEQLPDTRRLRRLFIIQESHRTEFDRALRLVGGEFVEIRASVDDLKAALDDRVAGVFYTFAWFCDGSAVPLDRVSEIAHERDLPVIVDAAAEVPPVENLRHFVEMGADLVAFSGGKAIGGPQASGLILGRSDLVEACRMNDSPYHAVGRGMNVEKEEIAGLVKAVELYLERDHNEQMSEWEDRVEMIMSRLYGIEGISVKRQLPFGVGQQIPHAAISWDEAELGFSLSEVTQTLLDGEPRIAVQLHHSADKEYNESLGPQIRVHPHTLSAGQERTVADRLYEVLVGKIQSYQ